MGQEAGAVGGPAEPDRPAGAEAALAGRAADDEAGARAEVHEDAEFVPGMDAVADDAGDGRALGGVDLAMLRPDHQGRGGLQRQRAVRGSQCAVPDGAAQHVEVADEIPDEKPGRMIVDLLWGAELLDPGMVEQADAVGEGQRLILVIGHEHGGGAGIAVQALDLHLRNSPGAISRSIGSSASTAP